MDYENKRYCKRYSIGIINIINIIEQMKRIPLLQVGTRIIQTKTY